MQDLKNYLNDRIKFLYEVANADPSEDSLSVLGQIHEIKHILNWIDEHENTTEPQTTPVHDFPKEDGKTEAAPCK